MNRRRVLTLTVSAMAMALASACGGGSGKAIKVVIAEYSKDHTRPFWQGAGRAVHQADRREGRSAGHRLELDRPAGQHDDPEQPAARRPEPELVLELRQGRPALLRRRGRCRRRPARTISSRPSRGAASTGASSTGSRSCRAPAPSSTTRISCARRRRRAAQDLGRVRAGGREDPGAGRRRDRLCAAARARGSAGRVVHLDVEQRRRLEVGRRVGDQQRQERRRRCRSWPTSPTGTRSPRSIPARPTAPTAPSSSSRTARSGW